LILSKLILIENCKIFNLLGIWREVFSINFDRPVEKCFHIWGTTLINSYGEEGC
jgi:hypothetical protein